MVALRTDASAQARSAPPNPMLGPALATLAECITLPARIADLGCGKLRHFGHLAEVASHLYLVDTEQQLNRAHVDKGEPYVIRDWAKEQARRLKIAVTVSTDREFNRSRLELDAVACIAVFDVVPPTVRRAITKAAIQNLRRGGTLILVIPRNDVTITRRCEVRYADGFVFEHHGLRTFYRNFGAYAPLLQSLARKGLQVLADLSKHKQICLVLKKQ